jgi:hypothetical protein
MGLEYHPVSVAVPEADLVKVPSFGTLITKVHSFGISQAELEHLVQAVLPDD